MEILSSILAQVAMVIEDSWLMATWGKGVEKNLSLDAGHGEYGATVLTLDML